MPRLLLLTEGFTSPSSAKTAVNLLRYRRGDVVALLDHKLCGRTTQQVLGVGGNTPIVARIDQAPVADALVLGVAFSGRRLPVAWRRIIHAAISSRLDVISGLHYFLSDDPEFTSAARRSGSRLIDIRRNSEHSTATRVGFSGACLRVHTVGQDCCVGKMVVAVELARALQRIGCDAKFIATGQTGILIEGDGCPIDSVVADCVSGAVERQVLANKDREVLIVEGQGAISHPRYSAVTTGLLHGCVPHAIILCYEPGRRAVLGLPHVPLKALSELLPVYEKMARLAGPCRTIGVAMNSSMLSPLAAKAERERVHNELGLPACDVLRDGPETLVEEIVQMRRALAFHSVL